MQIRNRTLRLFVSSTFNDMHEERDALCRFVFPYIEDFCNRRNIGFTGIDLRWGVTEEEVKQGKTIGLCLKEVDSCRPYFLGILGERYGWIPDRKLTMEYAGLFHGGLSITEVEMVYGAFNKNTSQRPKAFFCLRHPDLTRRFMGEMKEDVKSQKLLERLKKRIRESNYPLLDGYTSIPAFSAFICKRISDAIEEDFPLHVLPEEYESESVAHTYYAQSRNEVFAGRDRELVELDAFFTANNGSSLFITGASGAGKTALLAHWALHRQESRSDSFIFTHFCGASIHSEQWENVAKRLIYELCNKYNLPFKLPDTSGELIAVMQEYLHIASSKGREIILVLDSIDLVNSDKSFGLAWLPDNLPYSVKMLLSVNTAEGKAILLRRGYKEYKLQMLQPDEQQKLITTHLSPYGKRLNDCHLTQILRSASAKNPLFLRVLLHELCIHATHERMDRLLAWYLEAKNIQALFEKVIETCCKTYDNDYCNEMTRDVLTLLCCARHGLTENELLSIIGVPIAAFSPLYLALRLYLVNRNGILNFAFIGFRDAVRHFYLTSSESILTVRRRLVVYFLDKRTQHAYEELPWLLEKTASWSRLHELLCDLKTFHLIWKHNPSEVKMFWKKIEAKTKKKRIASYSLTEAQIRRTSKQIILALATFFFETGYPKEAEKLLLRLCNIRAQRKNRDVRQHSLGLLGNLYFVSGQYREAKICYHRKMAICKKEGDRFELSRVLGNLGVMEEMTGNFNKALSCFTQTGQEYRRLGFVHGIQASMGNSGNIYMKMKMMDEASKLFKMQEQICRESGHLSGLVAALGNRGFLMLEQEKYKEALKLFDEQETFCKKISDVNQLQIIYGNRAVALYHLNRKPEALKWIEQQLAVSEQIDNFDGQQKALSRLAIFRYDEGEKLQALDICYQRVELCRRHRAKIPYVEALQQYAIALKACNRDTEAQAIIQEAKSME